MRDFTVCLHADVIWLREDLHRTSKDRLKGKRKREEIDSLPHLTLEYFSKYDNLYHNAHVYIDTVMHWLGGPWTEVMTGKLLDVTIDKRKNDPELWEGQVGPVKANYTARNETTVAEETSKYRKLEDRVKCLKAEYERKQNLRLACLDLPGCRRQ